MTPPGSAGTAGRDYKIEAYEGRHRAPPPPPKPWPVRIAVADAVLCAAALIALTAQGIAPDATSAASAVDLPDGAHVTERTAPAEPGPLVIPSVGVVATPPEIALSRPVPVPRVQGHATPTLDRPTVPSVAITDQSETTDTPQETTPDDEDPDETSETPETTPADPPTDPTATEEPMPTIPTTTETEPTATEPTEITETVGGGL